jgi:hypothetical protein
MSTENKKFEKYTKIFATFVSFATGVLLNISPIAGENLISTKDQLTCKPGPDQQVLVVKDPKPEQKEMLEIVCMMLNEIPDFLNIAILNDDSDPRIASYNITNKSINLKITDIKEDGRNIIAEKSSQVEIIRKRIGLSQETLEKHPELIIYFMIIHEFGHAQTDRLLYLDYEYYQTKYPELHENGDYFVNNLINIEENRMPLPNLTYAAIKNNGTYVSPRLLENQARYYRYKVTELYADRFAGRFLYEYLKITHPDWLNKECEKQYKINKEYTSKEGLRKLIDEFLTKDKSWFLNH